MELIDTNAAAKILLVHPGTLVKWRWAQTGPDFIKVGRSVRYRAEDLQAFVEKGRVTVGSGN